MAKVCVLPNKYVTGWDGDTDNPTEEYPVLDLVEALEAVYLTDAHFTVGLINDESQPRLRKWMKNGGSGALPLYRALGLDPAFDCIAVDIDHPKELPQDWDPDAWWRQHQTLLSMSPLWATAGWYLTNGGYRLVWTLDHPVNAEAYEILQKRIYSSLGRVGVLVDALPDWTRLFRLPRVEREDRGTQNFPYDFNNLGHLPIDKLDIVEKTGHVDNLAKVKLGSIWDADLDQGNRNSGLLKLGVATIKGLPDLPDEYLELFLRSIHDVKCSEPLPEGELTRIINNARRYRPAPLPSPAATPVASVQESRQQVLVTAGEKPRALDDTLAVLAQNKGAIWNMGGGLVRLRRDVEDVLYMEEIPPIALRIVVERLVEFVTPGSKGNIKQIDAPMDLINMLASLADYGSSIWKLQEILTTPTLLPSGQPLLEPGYHEDLQLFLDVPDDLRDLDLTGDPQEAFDRVADLVIDVPFEKPVHKAVAMASFITPVVRTAIPGPVPIVLFDSAVRGAGKGLLTDVTSIIATGRKAVIQPYVDETEFEKRVTALLQMGCRTVAIDNIDRPFGGATLDALLTSTTWTGRILGETQMIKFRSRAHWMATGNNIVIKGDLDRRAIRCYILPLDENPEHRDPNLYKYPELLDHIARNRRQYVQDILTFMKAFMDKGCPKAVPFKGLGSFDDWSRLVRGAVIHYGLEDPVASQDALRTDSSTAIWSQFLQACSTLWGDAPFTARDIYEAAKQPSGKGNRLIQHQLEACLEELSGGDKITARGVSPVLKKWLNRTVDSKRLVRPPGKDRNKGYVYYVEAT